MPYLPAIDTTHALCLHPTCLSFAPFSHIFFVAALEFFKIIVTFAVANAKKEDWQSDRMRWTRNPVYPFPGIGGLNPSSSAEQERSYPCSFSLFLRTKI